MNEPVTFGRLLKRLRGKADLTQEALAERVGCAAQTIRMLEGGLRRPSRELAERLADMLGVPLDERVAFVHAARVPIQPTTNAVKTSTEVHEQANTVVVPELRVEQVVAPREQHPALPSAPNALIGRAEELGELKQLLQGAQVRLLTLLGSGGVGKTRLALQAAAELAAHFADGTVWVALASVAAPEHVASLLADALGVPLHGAQFTQEQLLSYLEEREMLLVLDNFEHLLEAVDLCTTILARAPKVRILVTSRERLRVRGEWVVELGGLTLPSEQARQNVTRSAAVLLFLERAQQVDYEWAITSQNQAAITRICQLLAGVPLAIELAASWIRVLTPAEIAAEIERTLDFVETAWRDTPARHRSLRAVFEHSWQLLAASEREALCRLAIFQNGFVRAAAVKVAGANLPLLASLTDKSLLRRNAGGRYEMHPLVQQYAFEKLREHAGWLTETSERHAGYYAQWLHALEDSLRGSMSEEAGVGELRAELDNLRLAWNWMVDQRQATLLEQAAGSLAHYFQHQCWFQEGATSYARAAHALELHALAEGDKAPSAALAVYGLMLGYQGWFTFRVGQSEQARNLLQQSLAVLRSQPPQVALYFALFWLGYTTQAMGEYGQAQQLLRESLGVARAIENQWCIAYALTILGQVSHAQGELKAARNLLEEALAIWRVIGGGIGPCLNRLAAVLLDMEHYDAGRALLQESVQISSNRNDPEDTAAGLVLLGKAAALQGKTEEAIYLLRESVAVFTEHGAHERRAKALVDLGWAYLAQAQCDAAQATFAQALNIAHTMQLMPIALNALLGLATLAQDDPERALELLLWIINHAAAEHTTHERAKQLQAQLASHLEPSRLAALHQRVATEPFEAVLGIQSGV